MAFETAKINWRYFEKNGEEKTALVVGAKITDSEFGEKDFKIKITGDELQQILDDVNPNQKGLKTLKSKLKSKYVEWVNSQQNTKSTEQISGNPELTSLD